MSFAKSFIVSIIALMALNALILVITYAVGYGFDSLGASITANPMFILYMLFSSTGHAIWVIISVFTYAIGSDPFDWSFFIVHLGFIIAPLIAAVITGRFSENRIHSFAGFFLSTLISMLICIILVYQSFTLQMLLGVALNQTEALMNVIFGSLVNGLIYGIVAFLTTKK